MKNHSRIDWHYAIWSVLFGAVQGFVWSSAILLLNIFYFAAAVELPAYIYIATMLGGLVGVLFSGFVWRTLNKTLSLISFGWFGT